MSVRRLAEEAFGFEEVEALGHVAFGKAEELADGEGVVGEGIGAGEVPEGEDVDGFETFGGGGGAEFAAEEGGETFEQKEGAIGGHEIDCIATIPS